MKDFVTPADHVGFMAKKMFGHCGEVINCSIAYLSPGGGGPTKIHTHEHDHLFVGINGQAKIMIDDREVFLGENESYLVEGSIIPHSVWNAVDRETVMIGISVKHKN